MSKVISATKETFQKEIYESELPVIVDFYTDGCGPCQAMEPILEELAKELEGKLKIAKFYVSVDELMKNSNEIVEKYEVMGFPTFLFFKNGELVKTEIGYYPKEEFEQVMEKVLAIKQENK